MSQPETEMAPGSSELGAQAAANLTTSILQEFAANGDDNAARILAAQQGEPQVAEAPVVVSSPPPAADAAQITEPPAAEPVQEAPAVVVPDFTPKLDEDYQALLDEPDFAEEAAMEVEAQVEEQGYDPEFDTDAARKIRELEKRNQWLEQQNAKSNKGKWVAEAKRSFPVFETFPAIAAELDTITATSRRGFAKEAAKLNQKYTTILGPALAEAAQLIEAAKQQAEKETRAKAAAQWGLPAHEPVGTDATLSLNEQKLVEARARNAPLEERIKILANLTPS